jgi:hypothetical protein
METVGVYLKREREARNISLNEVSHATKISKFYLDNIERDDFEKLPQGPYIKGYISSYSRLIGSNVDEALKLYESLNKKKEPPEEIECGPSNSQTRKAGIAEALNSLVASCRRLCDRIHPHELSPWTRLMQSGAASVGKIGVSINARVAAIRANYTPSKTQTITQDSVVIPFKAPDASLHQDDHSARTGISRFSAAALSTTVTRWLARWRSGLYAGLAVIGVGVLVLAGFGFYHLFIFDGYPAMPNRVSDQPRPSPASSGAEAKVPRTPTVTDTKKTDSTRMRQISRPLANDASKPVITAVPPRRTADGDSAVSSASGHIAKNSSSAASTAAAHVSVLKASICKSIQNRMPAGVETVFPASVQRVYVWSQVGAKQPPTEIRHVYYLEGRKVSDVTLHVRSSFWRTWSYKSIAGPRDRGHWRVDIATAGGKVLRRLYFKVE